MREHKIDRGFIDKLVELEYIYYPGITERTSLEHNLRSKFEPPEMLMAAHAFDGYSCFEQQKDATTLANIANKYHLPPAVVQNFLDGILKYMIFGCDQRLDLSWKAGTKAQLVLKEDCVPYLRKRPQGRDISGYSAYEQ